jgi:multidrug efflux pump subunit AcrB
MTQYSLNNKGVIIFFYVLVIFLGITAIQKIAKEEFPEFPKWQAVIITRMPGASPLKMEELVTSKIEEKLLEVGDLKEVTSVSQTGVSYVFPVIAEHIEQTKEIWDKVREKINDLRGTLPPGCSQPWLNNDLGAVKSFVIAITGEGFSNKELVDIADDLKKDFNQLQYVVRVDVIGEINERIDIEFSQAKISELGVSPEMIASTLVQQNLLAPGGDIRIGPQSIRLEPTGEFQSLDDIKKTVISIPGHSHIFFLKDIADITRTYENPPKMQMRYMGKDAVGIVVEMETGGQILELGESVKSLIKRRQDEMYIGIDLHMVNYQPKWVLKNIKQFINNLWQAVLIVLIIMFILLGWREALIISVLIPVSFLITIIVLDAISIPIHQISLVSLIIALGMLVDNGIVMTESISAYIRQGFDRIDAAVRSAKELSIPLLTATGTTVAAFLPIALAKSGVGIFCRTITFGVGIVLLSSFFVSMTLVPILCTILLKPDNTPVSKDKSPSFFGRNYNWLMHKCLKYKYVTLSTGIILLILVMTLVAPRVRKLFFPPSDRAQFLIDFYLPEGTDYRETRDQALIVETYLLENYPNEIRNTALYIGEQGPRFQSGVSGEQRTANYAQFVVNNHTFSQTQKMVDALSDYFRNHFTDAIGIVKYLESGPPVGAPIQVRVYGKDFKKLYAYANQIKNVCESIEGLRDVRDNWGLKIPKLSISINQDQARRVGVSTASIAQAFQRALTGEAVTYYREGDTSIPIIGRLKEQERNTIDRIQDINLMTAHGTTVPMAQVANLQMRWEAGKIRHRDLRRTITIQGYNAEGYNAQFLLNKIQEKLVDIQFESGYGITYGGEKEGTEIAQKSINEQIPISLAVLVMILVAQFSNVRKMTIILMTIPLAFIGVFTGLWLTDMAMGFMAFLGVISLAGIVVNNAILLIEQIDAERLNGTPPINAIIYSGQRRAFPIILTTLTTLSGLMPLSLSGDFWGPMAVTIMSGLLVSTILTLVMIPSLYAILFKVKYER